MPAHGNSKRPKRARVAPDTLAYNVSTRNKFTKLAKSDKRPITVVPKTAQEKLPVPITVTDTNLNIDEVLKPLNIAYKIKIISIGKKVFVESPDDRKTIIDAFQKTKVPCFTHPTNEEKIFKVVLSGLPSIDLDELKENIQLTNNLTPIKIIPLTSGKENILYLLHFNKNEVTLNDLRKINVVFSHIIKWLPYKSRKQGPTQCYNCGMFGHGASLCHRTAVCLLCSGDHAMRDCHIKQSTVQTDTHVYKCVNCMKRKLQHNHKATDTNCPARTEYIKFRTKKQTPTAKQPAHSHKSPNVHSARANTTTMTSPLFSFAQVAKNGPSIFTHTNTNTTPPNSANNNTHTPNTNVNGELWSFAEVSQILLNSIDALSKCKNKFDQLKVITNLLSNVIV